LLLPKLSRKDYDILKRSVGIASPPCVRDTKNVPVFSDLKRVYSLSLLAVVIDEEFLDITIGQVSLKL
jgi:hypothetical protein